MFRSTRRNRSDADFDGDLHDLASLGPRWRVGLGCNRGILVQVYRRNSGTSRATA